MVSTRIPGRGAHDALLRALADQIISDAEMKMRRQGIDVDRIRRMAGFSAR